MFPRRNIRHGVLVSSAPPPFFHWTRSHTNTRIKKWIALFLGTSTYLWYYHRGWLRLHQQQLHDLGPPKRIPPSDSVTHRYQPLPQSKSSNHKSAINQIENKDLNDIDNNNNIIVAADPTSLRKGIASFFSINTAVTYDATNITTLLYSQPHLYWKLLQQYEPYNNSASTKQEEYVCALGPGRGMEQDYGYALLSEKIRIDNNHDMKLPRVLCLIYTYPKMKQLQRTQALTWGWQCDGYLAFSTETNPPLGVVHLTHEGDESYDNMWQKVKSIWTYVYTHYYAKFDFFHLGGDDLMLLVPNLRKFLLPFLNQSDTPIYLGQWIPLPEGNNKNDHKYYVSGGPGYTLNRVALKRLVTEALVSCRVHVRASYEDRILSSCFRELNITGGDSRNVETGEQRYHDVAPEHLYTFRSTTTTGRGSFHAKSAAYWEQLPLPHNHHNHNGIHTVGPKHELQAADTYSVSFHDIYHSLYMARLHAILYPQTCPSTTPLGRALTIQGDCQVSNDGLAL